MKSPETSHYTDDQAHEEGVILPRKKIENTTKVEDYSEAEKLIKEKENSENIPENSTKDISSGFNNEFLTVPDKASFSNELDEEISKENLILLQEQIISWLQERNIEISEFIRVRDQIRIFAGDLFKTVCHIGDSMHAEIKPFGTRFLSSNDVNTTNSAHKDSDARFNKLDYVFAFSELNKFKESFLVGRKIAYTIDMSKSEIQKRTRVALYDNAIGAHSDSFYKEHILTFHDFLEYFVDYSGALLTANKYKGNYINAITECLKRSVYNYEYLVDFDFQKGAPEGIKILLDPSIVMPYKPEFQIGGAVSAEDILKVENIS